MRRLEPRWVCFRCTQSFQRCLYPQVRAARTKRPRGQSCLCPCPRPRQSGHASLLRRSTVPLLRALCRLARPPSGTPEKALCVPSMRTVTELAAGAWPRKRGSLRSETVCPASQRWHVVKRCSNVALQFLSVTFILSAISQAYE